MKHKAILNRVASLRKMIDRILEGTDNANNDKYVDNIKAVLKNMGDDLDKFEALIKGERKPTVGVFGCPSRGKSTLLNVLLGVNMLPMESNVGTTRFGIELSHKDTKSFSVTIKHNSKAPRTYRHTLLEDDVAGILKHLSDPDITKIEVQGPFRSYLGNDIVFIDTPGSELDAGEDNSPDGSPLKHDFKADTQRALAILSSVDVVIFCMRNNYKEKRDADFYNQAIGDRYEPINVINFGDKRDDDQTNEAIKLLVQKDYHLIKGHTVVVSSKEALEKIIEKIEKIEKVDEKDPAKRVKIKASGEDIEKLIETEFTGETLEGFKELKDKILERVTITAYDIEARLARFEELYETIKEDARGKGFNIGSDSVRVKKKQNIMALVGFLLGLVSLLGLIPVSVLIDISESIPLLWLEPMAYGIMGMIACVFGGIGLGKFNPETENNKWMAVSGMIFGILGIICSGLL